MWRGEGGLLTQLSLSQSGVTSYQQGHAPHTGKCNQYSSPQNMIRYYARRLLLLSPFSLVSWIKQTINPNWRLKGRIDWSWNADALSGVLLLLPGIVIKQWSDVLCIGKYCRQPMIGFTFYNFTLSTPSIIATIDTVWWITQSPL